MYRVLYKPSFHAECCLIVSDPSLTTGAAIVRFLSAGTNLWYRRTYEMRRDAGQRPEDEREPAPPETRLEEGAVAGGDAVIAFVAAVPRDFPSPVLAAGAMIDGMAVEAEWFRPGTPPVVARSNSLDDPATWALAVAVLRLALDTFAEPATLAVLRGVQRYVP